MEYTEADLPVEIKHGEMVVLGDGVSIRFEANGEAKDIFLGDEWTPTIQLFPDCDHELSTTAGVFKMTALFHDALRVEKIR